MADKIIEDSENSNRTRSENKQPDLTLGKAPIEKGERTGSRISVPVTQEKEATQKELNEIEPPDRIPSILRTIPVRRETNPERSYVSRESVSPIGYPPEPPCNEGGQCIPKDPSMGKILRDRLQNRDVDKGEATQFEEDSNLDSGNLHEASRDWSQGIESQARRDEEERGEEHIYLDKTEDFNSTSENLQSQCGDSNKEHLAENTTEKVISDQGKLQDDEGVSLKENEPEHYGSTHEQWPCLRCEQDNDYFTRNISEQQEEMAVKAGGDSGMPNEWWHYSQYDDENERFLPSALELQRNPKPDDYTHHVREARKPEPALECDPSREGTTSETNATNLQKPLQELVPDAQEPRRIAFPTLAERVEILRVQFDAVLERNKHLEESLANLMRKENALKVILDRQTQQISSIDERQVEQERVLLAPMRSIYIRQFHDLIRESISQKMSGTFIYARQMWALKQRVNQHERGIRERLVPASHGGDLWQFIKEAHTVAPKFFCKGNLWNKFLDLILEDKEQLRILDLSAAAVELTRYGRSPPPGARGDLQSNRQDAHFRNELVFAEVVAGQSDELRPLYAELYEFFYKVPPDTMYIKVRGRYSVQGMERVEKRGIL